MKLRTTTSIYYLLFWLFSLIAISVNAQTDTSTEKKTESLLGKVIENFKKDTTIEDSDDLRTNEQKYLKYDGFIIRDIIVHKLPFGIPLSDTTKKLVNTLTELANKLHHTTRTQVIKNNLFFKKNTSLQPYLMADNERFLRQLPYLQDAGFIVVPVAPHSDSVDVIVIVKDVFSLGGAIGSLGLNQSQVQFQEDNFAGTGNAAILYALYDSQRKKNLAFGGEYIRRNIGGSFIDGVIGYQSFYPVLNGPKEENFYYVNLLKPLVNRYMQLTYEVDLSYHSTRNLYTSDSVYQSDFRYRYHKYEAWAGYNINARQFSFEEESSKLRKLVGLRFINQKFNQIPQKYVSDYNWRYADIKGLLATVTFYRQNFYKTKYIYGFGRNEDIPEGLSLSLTTGYTIKENRSRPFVGFNYQRYHFNDRRNYLDYKLRAEGYLNKSSVEDINLFASADYFDHLKPIGTRWKQRFFLSVDAAQQVNSVLNEPLYLNSQFGLPEYGRDDVGGTLRTTVKAESVFFSPWSLAAFRFAPFVFSNISLFSPYLSKSKVYTSIGGGLRTRNESFVFGTVEIKGFYFPEKNFYNSSFSLELTTNVIFKYDKQFVKKPDFIEIN